MLENLINFFNLNECDGFYIFEREVNMVFMKIYKFLYENNFKYKKFGINLFFKNWSLIF